MGETRQTPLRRSPVRAAPPPSSIHVYGDPRLDLTFDDSLADCPTATSEAARRRARQLGKRRADSHSCALARITVKTLGRRLRSTIRGDGGRRAATEHDLRRGSTTRGERGTRAAWRHGGLQARPASPDLGRPCANGLGGVRAPARACDRGAGARSVLLFGRPRVPVVEPVRLDRKPVGIRPGAPSARKRDQPPAKELRGGRSRSENSERDRSHTVSGFRKFPCSSAADERARRRNSQLAERCGDSEKEERGRRRMSEHAGRPWRPASDDAARRRTSELARTRARSPLDVHGQEIGRGRSPLGVPARRSSSQLVFLRARTSWSVPARRLASPLERRRASAPAGDLAHPPASEIARR
jgi:hypothetical protein